METQTQLNPTTATHLFDFNGVGNAELGELVSSADREGAFIGSAEGPITGERLTGTLRFSMYAKDCAILLLRNGIEPPADQHLCTTSPGGYIETDDGARIFVEGRGFGNRGADPARPHIWNMAMTVHFATDDERYAWINNTISIWDGVFDEATGTNRYVAYAADLYRAEPAPGGPDA